MRHPVAPRPAPPLSFDEVGFGGSKDLSHAGTRIPGPFKGCRAGFKGGSVLVASLSRQRKHVLGTSLTASVWETSLGHPRVEVPACSVPGASTRIAKCGATLD